MSLEFFVKQIMGEIKIPKSVGKPTVVEKKEPIVYRCYAHIMNNGSVGLNKKDKIDDEDKNIIFDGDTKKLLGAEKIEDATF